ncbi:efflux RND transporter periplasmic adaptor subunit [Pedobacter sp. GR22-6]|uniref:efflux RND transporter periplasmic adaptor subunit n=1 Tax=Pedobacter sp. GR22-6 TaxID=3127957 RepID=UPI00307DF6A1
MKRKHIIVLIVLVLVGLIIFKLSSNKRILEEKKQPEKDTLVRIPVKVAAVVEELRTINLVKTGSLAPFKEAKVLAPMAGTIAQLKVNLGDQVQEGQVLAVIDTRLMQLDLQKAVSNARKLERDLATYTELLAGQAATQEKVNELRQSHADAINQVAQLKKQIADAYIKAPTSGTVATKAVEVGVFANAGAEIATIVNLSQAKVQLNLTESEVYQTRQGQEVKISTDVYPDAEFKGKVSFISPQADETRSYKVELIAENKQSNLLRSGTFVYADFSRQTEQKILLIPREAITESVKDAFVYVLDQDKVRQRQVKTGIESGSSIQIISGLKAGERVVTSGQINLKEGTAISISK